MGDNIKRNTAGLTPFNITRQMRGYRRRTRDIGGFWTAEGTFWTGKDDPIVSRQEAETLFLTGIGNHVIEAFGSTPVFEGLITAMTYTHNGTSTRRDLGGIVNSLKVNYSHFTGNLLLNGSAEIGTISAYQAEPNAQTQSGTGVYSARGWMGASGYVDHNYPVLSIETSWCSHGTKSFYLDCSPCIHNMTTYDGEIFLTTGIAVVPGGKYKVSGFINYAHFRPEDPGRFVRMQVSAGTDVLYTYETPAAEGIYYFSGMFEAPDDAAGDLGIIFNAYYGTLFYVDGITLQEVGSHKETPYASNADSIALYGLSEDVIVCGSLGDDEAITRRDNLLSELAWPRSIPEKPGSSDGLTVEMSGYVFKLETQSASIGGLLAASTHINNLIPLSSFVSLGYVATNALLTYVAEDKPTKIWEAVQKVTESGGVSEAKYICGCGPGRTFNYQPRSTTARYKLRRGKWYNMDNSLADAQAMQPAIVFFEDLPAGPGIPPNATLIDDPRYMWVYEWEYDADTDTATPTDWRSVWE
jgi:hypothetical protein